VCVLPALVAGVEPVKLRAPPSCRLTIAGWGLPAWLTLPDYGHVDDRSSDLVVPRLCCLVALQMREGSFLRQRSLGRSHGSQSAGFGLWLQPCWARFSAPLRAIYHPGRQRLEHFSARRREEASTRRADEPDSRQTIRCSGGKGTANYLANWGIRATIRSDVVSSSICNQGRR